MTRLLNRKRSGPLPRRNAAGLLHLSLRRTLFACRLLGLLPIEGLCSAATDKIRLTWKSLYTLYYILSFFGQLFISTMSFYRLMENGFALADVANFVFYFSGLVSAILIFRIGRAWPQVLRKARRIEATLPAFTRNIGLLCDFNMIVILLIALVEDVLAMLTGVSVAWACNPSSPVETYYKYEMPAVFEYVSYSLWKGIFLELFNFQATFMWTFNDVLIIVTSLYLTEHFKIIEKALKNSKQKGNTDWQVIRVQYTKASILVRLVNDQISPCVLISFASNMFWICMQLFNNLRKSYSGYSIMCIDNDYQGTGLSFYFTFSFVYLVARMLAVSLVGARVHDTSKAPLVALYDVPPAQYDFEVVRFSEQVCNMTVALSGMDFFHVTRSMILTLLGTIVTYELVLLQFSPNSPMAHRNFIQNKTI